jgi:hypothetical protein
MNKRGKTKPIKLTANYSSLTVSSLGIPSPDFGFPARSREEVTEEARSEERVLKESLSDATEWARLEECVLTESLSEATFKEPS